VLVASMVIGTPTIGQGVGATLKGAAWGGLVVAPVAGTAVATAMCGAKSSEGGARSAFWRCGRLPFAVAAGVATVGGVYLGARRREALGSVRRGAWIGLLVATPVGMMLGKRPGGSGGFDLLGAVWAGAAVGAVVGAVMHDSGTGTADGAGNVVMLPVALRF